jgi:uncharacterized protein YjiS (DUF1127 family)
MASRDPLCVAALAQEDKIMDQIAPSAAGLLRTPVRAIRRWYSKRQMHAALSSLDDTTLKDIGLYRCEIPAIVRVRHDGV